MDIGVGDWVERVRVTLPTNSVVAETEEGVPAIGEIRQVREVRVYAAGAVAGGLYVKIAGMRLLNKRGGEMFVSARHFRKVYRPKSELFTHLLQPVEREAV